MQAQQLSGQDADRVQAYFGMREVSLGPVGPGGHPRPLINGEFVFQIGMLDQVTADSLSCGLAAGPDSRNLIGMSGRRHGRLRSGARTSVVMLQPHISGCLTEYLQMNVAAFNTAASVSMLPCQAPTPRI